jgi:hypothetical protein
MRCGAIITISGKITEIYDSTSTITYQKDIHDYVFSAQFKDTKYLPSKFVCRYFYEQMDAAQIEKLQKDMTEKIQQGLDIFIPTRIVYCTENKSISIYIDVNQSESINLLADKFYCIYPYSAPTPYANINDCTEQILKNVPPEVKTDASEDSITLPVVTTFTTQKIVPCTKDAEALEQIIQAKCSNIMGDLPYNTKLGVPLHLSIQNTRLAILNTINSTPGVQSTEVLKYEIKDKRFVMNLKIHTNFGTIITTV